METCHHHYHHPSAMKQAISPCISIFGKCARVPHELYQTTRLVFQCINNQVLYLIINMDQVFLLYYIADYFNTLSKHLAYMTSLLF